MGHTLYFKHGRGQNATFIHPNRATVARARFVQSVHIGDVEEVTVTTVTNIGSTMTIIGACT